MGSKLKEYEKRIEELKAQRPSQLSEYEARIEQLRGDKPTPTRSSIMKGKYSTQEDKPAYRKPWESPLQYTPGFGMTPSTAGLRSLGETIQEGIGEIPHYGGSDYMRSHDDSVSQSSVVRPLTDAEQTYEDANPLAQAAYQSAHSLANVANWIPGMALQTPDAVKNMVSPSDNKSRLEHANEFAGGLTQPFTNAPAQIYHHATAPLRVAGLIEEDNRPAFFGEDYYKDAMRAHYESGGSDLAGAALMAKPFGRGIQALGGVSKGYRLGRPQPHQVMESWKPQQSHIPLSVPPESRLYKSSGGLNKRGGYEPRPTYPEGNRYPMTENNPNLTMQTGVGLEVKPVRTRTDWAAIDKRIEALTPEQRNKFFRAVAEDFSNYERPQIATENTRQPGLNPGEVAMDGGRSNIASRRQLDLTMQKNPTVESVNARVQANRATIGEVAAEGPKKDPIIFRQDPSQPAPGSGPPSPYAQEINQNIRGTTPKPPPPGPAETSALAIERTLGEQAQTRQSRVGLDKLNEQLTTESNKPLTENQQRAQAINQELSRREGTNKSPVGKEGLNEQLATEQYISEASKKPVGIEVPKNPIKDAETSANVLNNLISNWKKTLQSPEGKIKLKKKLIGLAKLGGATGVGVGIIIDSLNDDETIDYMETGLRLAMLATTGTVNWRKFRGSKLYKNLKGVVDSPKQLKNRITGSNAPGSKNRREYDSFRFREK